MKAKKGGVACSSVDFILSLHLLENFNLNFWAGDVISVSIDPNSPCSGLTL